MGAEADKRVTAYVRYVVLGVDSNDVAELARKFTVSKATITNIRNGKAKIGVEVLTKIANVHCGGSLDRLRELGADFAAQRPELVEAAPKAAAKEAGSLASRDRQWLEAVLKERMPLRLAEVVARKTAWQHDPKKTKPQDLIDSAIELAQAETTDGGHDTDPSEVKVKPRKR